MNLPQKNRYFEHIGLFGLTVISTLCAGVYLKYNNFLILLKEPSRIWRGYSLAVPLLMILLAHEMGHYILAKRHKIYATLPYFIPFPNIIGTMGAIIKMKSPIPDRNALIDVGMAGPLAGIIVTIPVTILGLMMSELTVLIPTKATSALMLGESILFKILKWLVYGPLPSNVDIKLHPVAFAGWVGILITFMNLFPASQLDGGHISYAIFGRLHKPIGKTTCFIFTIMGIFYWPWFIWLVLVFLIGINHPPPINDIEPLDRKRRILGFICMGIFVLTFIPRPFYGLDLPIDLLSIIRILIG